MLINIDTGKCGIAGDTKSVNKDWSIVIAGQMQMVDFETVLEAYEMLKLVVRAAYGEE